MTAETSSESGVGNASSTNQASAVPSVAARALALVHGSPTGVTPREAAVHLGVSWPTAANALARHFWAGRVDRHKDGRAYTYVPRHVVLEPSGSPLQD